jgi:multiple sugar transport system substrate-binding protein
MLRRIVVLSILLLALALVAACTGAPAPAGTGGESSGDAAVELRIWTHQNDAFNSGLQALADSYIAENPNVSITLQTARPAGTEADILQMFGSWVCSYAEGGTLAEVPTEVLTLEDAEAAIFAAQLAGYTCEDKLYGVPQEFNIEYGATLVNTAAAEEAGLTDISAAQRSARWRHDARWLSFHRQRRDSRYLLLAYPPERRPISD